jgi:iron complex transport system substrate-binding protein
MGCADRTAPPAATGPPRIVTLAPSLTEIAYAIGCGGELVGDTSFDDYPAQARRLPHVADLVHVDLERLALVAPSTVVALHDQERQGAQIVHSLGLAVAYLPNRTFEDLYADIAGVGAACGKAADASALSERIRSRIAAIVASAPRDRARPRVLYLLGLPGYTVGKDSYLDEVIRLAGGANVAGDVDQPYPDLDAESIVALDPEVIVVAKDTPFGPDVRSREPWRDLAAVRDGRVYSPPDDDIIERPGPRIVEGIAWLAGVLRSK